MSVRQSQDEVSQNLADLSNLEIEALKRRWRKLAGKHAPVHLPRHLLVRLVAYRIQATAFGDLESSSVKVLREIAKSRADRGAGTGVPTLESLELSARRTGHLAPGTVIGREHDGTMHHVMVLAEGFGWNGKTYRSLSEVAFAITGTKWNGPRFFGLKAHRKPSRDDAKSDGAR